MKRQTVQPVLLSVDEGLLASSRARPWSRLGVGLSLAELAVLGASGAAAAAANVLLKERHLHVPGHAILQAILPMVCGLSLVPRRGAGTLMGLSALMTALAFRLSGFGISSGSLTSLLAVGPLLDLAMIGGPSGWRLYLRCIGAGLAANLCAFAARWGLPLIGLAELGDDASGPRWAWKLSSHLVCGAAAGLVSAAIWFRLSSRGETAPVDDSPVDNGASNTRGPSR